MNTNYSREILFAQSVFNRFKSELGGFTSCAEISESKLEIIKDIGACYFHIRRDDQVTIRKLAVLPEYQKQGWGRLLIYRVICAAIESQKKSIFLKCPENLESNSFYKNIGFNLEYIEQGKNKKINHWRLPIVLPLLFYCGAGGKSKFDILAQNVGWQLGVNSGGKNKPVMHMKMIDNNFKNYCHQQHLEMVRKHKPLIATALDIVCPEQLPIILGQAEELSQYCGRVLIIPKCKIDIPEKFWLGYSVASGYGSTPLSTKFFKDRPVHLLGGSPQKQVDKYHQMNVVSLDANYAMKLAVKYSKSIYSDGIRNITVKNMNSYNALEVSLQEQMNLWQKIKPLDFVQLELDLGLP